MKKMKLWKKIEGWMLIETKIKDDRMYDCNDTGTYGMQQQGKRRSYGG